MDFIIKINGADEAAEAQDLKRWIIKTRLTGLQSIEQERHPPQPGEQGPTLLAVITVVLAGPAVVELAKSVQSWIQTRKRTIKIEITQGDKKINIEADNPEDVNVLIDKAREAFLV